MDDVEIHALTPERLEDYLYFMEHDAFGGNPDWADCYCLEGHTTEGEAALERSPQERRSISTELITRRAHHGLLAYRNKKVVGWCHATPLSALRYEEYRLGRSDDEVAHIGSIVCFNLAEEVRRAGLPAVLLREALKRFAEGGLTQAEAYPWKDPNPQPQRNYLGTIHMYALHGFEQIQEIDEAVLMRRPLTRKEPAT